MELSPRQIAELKGVISGCLERLYRDDADLISRHGVEPAVIGTFYGYVLEAVGGLEWLRGLRVDTEYNKNGLDSKRTVRKPNGIRPDIIIHRRGYNEANVLVMEIKGWSNTEPREDDIVKLEDLTNQEEEYKYGLAVFLDLGKVGCKPEYFAGGQRVDI